MPLYNDLEVRPSVRLEPTDQMDMSTLALEAAKAGALGAPVAAGGLGAVRGAMIPYAEREAALRAASGLAEARLADVIPGTSLRIGPEVRAALEEYTRRHQERFPGEPVVGEGSRSGRRGIRQTAILNPEIDPGDYVGAREAMKMSPSHPLYRDPGGERAIRSEMWRDTVGDRLRNYKRSAPLGVDPWSDEIRALDEARRVRGEARAAVRAGPRLGGALKSGIKGMLNPASIAADALLGGAVGAGSALGGYAAGGGSPESAGLFTAPGPGYEGVVSPELIERIAEQKEREREAERQRLLRQYEASGYDLDPNIRLSELR